MGPGIFLVYDKYDKRGIPVSEPQLIIHSFRSYYALLQLISFFIFNNESKHNEEQEIASFLNPK